MYLIRRGVRIIWISPRFLRLNNKCKSHTVIEINPVNQALVSQLHVQTNSNSPYALNPQSDILKILKTNSAQYPRGSSNTTITSNCMGYAEVKQMVDKNCNSASEDESFALRLLEACRDMLPDASLEARQELVQKAWDMLNKLGQTFTLEHYKVLLSIYAKNLQYVDAEEFLSAMKVTPDKDTYRLLLDAVAEVGDYGQALSIIAKIKEIGYPINEAILNSLTLAYSINADIDGAQAVLDTMQAARIELNSASYCALSRGYAAKGDLVNLKKTLRTGNLNTKQLMSVIKSLSISGHGKYISEVLSYLPRALDIRSNDCVYAIVELTHLGKARDAFEIVNSLPVQDTSTDPSAELADFFLHELVKSDTPMEEILEICNNLSSNQNLTALLKVTEAALRLSKEEIALSAFGTLRNNGYEIRPHFYWPLLINAAASKQGNDVMRLVKHMIDNEVQVEDETLSNYIIPYLPLGDPLITVRRLQDYGVKISHLLTPLLATLLSAGNLKQASTLADQIKGKVNEKVIIEHLLNGYLLTKNVNDTVDLLSHINSSSGRNGSFLTKLVAQNRVTVTNEELVSLIFAFDKKKLKICKISADILEPRIMLITEPKGFLETFKQLIETQPNPKNAAVYAWIPHPRDMTIEELEDHLVDLSTKGMNTRGVLRKLLQAYCGKNNLKKAEATAKVFTDQGYEWTIGMISGMFALYTAHDMLDKADILYKELRRKYKRFKIDEYKILDYATALVRNNKLERAMEVLAEQENVRSGKETSRNCARLLNAVATAGDSDNTKRVLDLLIEKGYCEISTPILGPLIRKHLVNNDLPAAITEFKAYARIHKKLPLQQELVRAILQTYTDQSEVQNKLTEVLTAIKNIYGESAANSQLLMALAATNKQKELHTFMKMSNVNQTMLSTSTQRLTDEKDLSALQTILKAHRGIVKLDGTIIYKSILTLCCRTGDCKTALKIWDKMQSEENIHPSGQFIAKLKDLLESQRVPLPTELVSNKRNKIG